MQGKLLNHISAQIESSSIVVLEPVYCSDVERFDGLEVEWFDGLEVEWFDGLEVEWFDGSEVAR